MDVLIVEPSKVVRDYIRKILESFNLSFYEAQNAKECLGWCAQKQFDVITLSVMLPDKTGYEVCQTIRNSMEPSEYYKNRDAAIVFVTSQDTMEERARGFTVGASEFLLKRELGNQLKAFFLELLSPPIFNESHILVVDDSELNRMVIFQILKKKTSHIYQAENGLEALNALFNPQNAIDLIITDLNMPVMDGFELCRRIRLIRTYKNLPIIVLSGASSKDEILQIFKSGATDYLPKPFIKEELTARIDIHLKNWHLQKINNKITLNS